MSTPEKESPQSEQRRKLEDFNSAGRRNRRGRKKETDESRKRDPKSWRARWEEAKRMAEEADKKANNKNRDKDGKKKSPFKSAVSFIAVALLIGSGLFWFFAPGGFTSVKTSEGISILQDADRAKERIEVTDGSQIVRIWLDKEFTPRDLEGKKGSPTKKVQFQFVSAEAKKIQDLVASAKAKNGYNSIVPQQSFLGSIFSLMFPLLLLFALHVDVAKDPAGQHGIIRAREEGRVR